MKYMRYKGYTSQSGLMVVNEVQLTSARLASEQKSIKARPGLLQRRPIDKVLHLPDGTSVRIKIDESGVASEHEWDDHQDAVVRPNTYKVPIRSKLNLPDTGGKVIKAPSFSAITRSRLK